MPDPLADPRFEELVEELRDARIATPPRLGELVEELAERRPPPAPRPALRDRMPRLRRPPAARIAGVGLALFLVGGLVAMLAAGGHNSSTSASSSAAAGGSSAAAGAAAPAASVPSAQNPKLEHLAFPAPPTGTGFQSQQRLQHESVDMRVALADVPAVSDATTSVTRAIQAYGGYVVTLGFDASSSGESTIVAKLPFARIQEAIARFSGLGRVVAEHVDLTDLQKQYDTLEQQLAKADLRVARLKARLTDTTLTPAAAAALRVQLATAALQRADLRHSAQSTQQSAAMADLTLDLVSQRPAAAPAPATGGVGGAAEAAVDVLQAVGKGAVFLAIVAAPLIVIALAIWGGRRWMRVRRERRLLEQA
jgi:hypothetical protein